MIFYTLKFKNMWKISFLFKVKTKCFAFVFLLIVLTNTDDFNLCNKVRIALHLLNVIIIQ